MYIGIITLHKQKANMGEYYSSQDLGLANGMIECGHKVIVYKSISKDEYAKSDKSTMIEGVNITYLKSFHVGNHSYIDTNEMDPNIDCLICFSDNQIFYSKIYKWGKKNSIPIFPYIGTLSSKSDNALKSKVMDFINKKNISLYKKTTCFAKTLTIQSELYEKGVKNVEVFPVGLDRKKLLRDSNEQDIEEIKNDLGLASSTKVMLYVGRMIPSKQPLQLVEYFEKLSETNEDIHLIIIGKGPLEYEVRKKAEYLINTSRVTYITEVKNIDMWKYYSISDYFINLCRDEIYGMAILEAMFYKCIVLALVAPGPSYIIENRRTGFLFEEIEEIFKWIALHDNVDEVKEQAVKAISEKFTWDKIAGNMLKVVNQDVKLFHSEGKLR